MNREVLWYATRGAGAVSLVLLSGVVVLGLLSRLRVEGGSWPRFMTAALHRNFSLLALAFLAVHVTTAVVDPFTHLGLVAATVPFGSGYRTFWLGLGTLSLQVTLAVILSSALRPLIGPSRWRSLHWLAYAAWPIAVAHGLGTGTDTTSSW
ncbi:MAG: ferric reductase-like transmembrane domain-containing protein, partial [Actinobacteria bacterium]|nr:ferric reductase-like transmembrane domain-containing protein [Actinomycetota bacterium]